MAAFQVVSTFSIVTGGDGKKREDRRYEAGSYVGPAGAMSADELATSAENDGRIVDEEEEEFLRAHLDEFPLDLLLKRFFVVVQRHPNGSTILSYFGREDAAGHIVRIRGWRSQGFDGRYLLVSRCK